MSEEKLDDFKKKLEECEKLKNEYLAGWQRARADLLNYKREELERVGELIKFASQGLILKILPILDNFEIALQNFAKQNLGGQAENSQIGEGFLQIKKQLENFLKEQGVEEIKSVGERFDPNFHEVVEEVETNNKESGIIVEEVQKGYKIDGRLLRPTKVKIAK